MTINKNTMARELSEFVYRLGYATRQQVAEFLSSKGIVSPAGVGDVIRLARLSADKPNRRLPAKGYWPPED